MKERLQELWQSIKIGFSQEDKHKHLCAGAIITLATSVFLCIHPMWAMLLALVAALLKELWDSKGHGCVEFADVIFTLIGAVVVLPLCFCYWFFIVQLYCN